MTRKKTATKKTRGKSAELPKGFTAIGGFGKSWPNDDTKIGDSIQGTVTEYDAVQVTREGKKVESENLKIETADGSVVTVWSSAGTRILFDEDYTGWEVYLRYDGLGAKKKGRNAPRLYTIACKE